MSIFDISDQTSPVLKSYITLLGSYQVAVQGNYAYVPSSGGFVLYVVNITNPTNPTVTGSVNIGSASGSLYSCVVSGNYCYVATQNKGLTVIDVTNPASPTQVYQEGGTTNKSFGVAISGTTLYTTNYQTASPWTVRYLKTWDVSTPTAPVLLNTYTLPANTKPGNLSLSGNTAYVSDINVSRIHLIDVTTPTSPNFLSTITPSGTFNADFEGVTAAPNDNYLYIPSGSLTPQGGAIDLYDVSVKTSPLKLGTVYTNVSGSVFGGIALSGGYIFAADYGVAPGSTGTLDVFTMPVENLVAGSINYAPSTPANWPTVPSTVRSALDELALNTTVPPYVELHVFTGYTGATQIGTYAQPFTSLQTAVNSADPLTYANTIIFLHDSPTENVVINNLPNGLTIQAYATSAKDSQTIKLNGNITISGSSTRVRLKDFKIAYPGGTQPDLIDSSQGRNYLSNMDFGGGGGIQYTGSWARWHEYVDCTINGNVSIAGTPSAGSQVSMWRTRGTPTFTLNSSNVTLALYTNESIGTITNLAGTLVTDRFQSSVITASGSQDTIPHTLGAIPSVVLVSIQSATGGFNITEGTHDANNLYVTATSGTTYKVIALP